MSRQHVLRVGSSDEAEERRQRIDLGRRELAGDPWHRRRRSGMVTLAPLREPSLQVGI